MFLAEVYQGIFFSGAEYIESQPCHSLNKITFGQCKFFTDHL
jgi:hypothetical protein